MLRLALIGCGGHSEQAHARSLAHYVRQYPGEVELAAACDRDSSRAERFCQTYGFARAYAEIEAMLDAEKPDGVFSILPVEQTASTGKMLLQRGIPCVIEKPPGASLNEALVLAEVAEQTATPHLVSMNRRFNPFLNRARIWSAENGALRYVRGQMFRHARREEDFLWGTGIHLVDALVYIGGDVEAFDVRTIASSGPAPPWFLISVRFASGCVGHLEILPTCGVVEERFELFGDDFRACVTTMGVQGEALRCWKNGKLALEEDIDENTPLFLRDGSFEETSAFINGLKQGARLSPSLVEVLPALRICSAGG